MSNNKPVDQYMKSTLWSGRKSKNDLTGGKTWVGRAANS